MFFRYDVDFCAVAHYESKTCIVLLGKDRDDKDKNVCLKFMRHLEVYISCFSIYSQLDSSIIYVCMFVSSITKEK